MTREDWATNYENFRTEVTAKVDKLEERVQELKGERDKLDDALRLVSDDELAKAEQIKKLNIELGGKNAQIANISAQRDEAIIAKTATDNGNASLVSQNTTLTTQLRDCLLYTSDAADE